MILEANESNKITRRAFVTTLACTVTLFIITEQFDINGHSCYCEIYTKHIKVLLLLIINIITINAYYSVYN